MISRRDQKALVLSAALLGGLALFLFLLSAAPRTPSTPVVIVSTLRTNSGAIVTALVPEPYQPAAMTIVPVNSPAQALVPPAVSMSITQVSNGTQIDFYLVDDPQTPLSLRISTKTPNGGYSGFAGRLRNCWKFSNPRLLLEPYYDDVVDFHSEAILFGEAERSGSANLIAEATMGTGNERVSLHVGP